MLFRKKIPRSCTYCQYFTTLDEEQGLCMKKGIVAPDGKCRKFRYDPCKRIPPRPKPLDVDKYSTEDFSL